MIVDTLEGWWNTLIELTSKFVIPDWGALIGLLPILLLIGVVGPILTLLVLAWFLYLVRGRASAWLRGGPATRAARRGRQPGLPGR